jgi:protein TonB
MAKDKTPERAPPPTQGETIAQSASATSQSASAATQSTRQVTGVAGADRPTATTSASSDPKAQTDSQRRTMPRVDASWTGNLPPAYPSLARRLKLEGEVRLSVQVDSDGRVLKASVALSSGHDLLDSTAIESVKKWRFEPATLDGKPVADWYHDWRWHFRIHD